MVFVATFLTLRNVLVLGGLAKADAEARRPLAFWRSVGATAYVRRAEPLLAAAS